jgi:DNA-directed RNA polymerase III subunit RPC6
MAPPVARAKRPATAVAPTSKKFRPLVTRVVAPDAAPSSSSLASAVSSNPDTRERFLQVFDAPEYKIGISNSELKKVFGSDYISLAPVINDLTAESRLTMSRTAATGELFYQLVSAEVAQQFQGLDVSAKMVYQVIEKAGNMGIWTKDIRVQTNIQQQALNKIFKVLESRLLIKPVKSVTAKSKKLYMLYKLVPSKGT